MKTIKASAKDRSPGLGKVDGAREQLMDKNVLGYALDVCIK